MSDLFGNHIVGFLTRRLIICFVVLVAVGWMVYVVRFNYGKGKLYSGNIREGHSVKSINVNSLLLAIFCFYIYYFKESACSSYV